MFGGISRLCQMPYDYISRFVKEKEIEEEAKELEEIDEEVEEANEEEEEVVGEDGKWILTKNFMLIAIKEEDYKRVVNIVRTNSRQFPPEAHFLAALAGMIKNVGMDAIKIIGQYVDATEERKKKLVYNKQAYYWFDLEPPKWFSAFGYRQDKLSPLLNSIGYIHQICGGDPELRARPYSLKMKKIVQYLLKEGAEIPDCVREAIGEHRRAGLPHIAMIAEDILPHLRRVEGANWYNEWQSKPKATHPSIYDNWVRR